MKDYPSSIQQKMVNACLEYCYCLLYILLSVVNTLTLFIPFLSLFLFSNYKELSILSLSHRTIITILNTTKKGSLYSQQFYWENEIFRDKQISNEINNNFNLKYVSLIIVK